jgi:predicted permease
VASHIDFRNNPVRVHLPADWRVTTFSLALMLAVTLLFGLAPALRASAVKPASALKGGDRPHFRSRLMQALVAVQAAFCFLVLFAGLLFVTTFERLSGQSTGFSPARLLALEVLLVRPEPPDIWNQVVEHLRTVPGVASVGLSEWAPLSGFSSERHVSMTGGPPSPDPVFFLGVEPGWFGAMKIPLIVGRDFKFSDTYPRFAIVNEAFAKRYCPGENPVGKLFGSGADSFQIIGLIRNARYNDIHGPVRPVAYVPFRDLDSNGRLRSVRGATLMVRTATADPVALVPTLRKEMARARPGFRVSNVRTEDELIQSQTVRERLLAALALFFALVALLLAGIGFYGVLHYSVVQRQREIAIRMAVGAPARDITRRVMLDVCVMVLVGSVIGLAISLTSVRYIESLLYDVKSTDPVVLTLPWLIVTVAVVFSAVPSVIRAVRIDPAQTLRVE